MAKDVAQDMRNRAASAARHGEARDDAGSNFGHGFQLRLTPEERQDINERRTEMRRRLLANG
jgi:hypothetical protein